MPSSIIHDNKEQRDSHGFQTILMVDDEHHIRADFELYFGHQYHILTAIDGREALSVLMENEIDLLITDIQMLDIGGIELISQVRMIDSDLPIIVMTGFGSKDIAIKALKMGVIDFIEKPFDVKVMEQTLQQVFDRRKEKRIELSTQLHINSQEVIDLKTTNLSRDGIFVETTYPLEQGAQLEFKLKLVDYYPEIEGRGIVKWIRDTHSQYKGMGIKFIELYGNSLKIIENFIDLRYKKQTLNSQQYAPLIYLDIDDIKQDIYRIKTSSLDELIQDFAHEYNTFGHRDPFIWRWAYEGVVITSLNTVDKEWKESVYLTKVLGIMFVCLIDDIADEMQDVVFLNEALKIPFEPEGIQYKNVSSERQNYLKFTLKLWTVIESRLQTYPRYTEFKEILEFDNQMLANSMRHAYLINQKTYLLNMVEHDIYAPHNMYMVFMGMIDLCCSSSFDIEELGALREVFIIGQKMGRIGNMITTWEREIPARDFSSGIFAYGLINKVFTLYELHELESHFIVQKIKEAGIEEYFILEWEKMYSRIHRLSQTIHSVEIIQLLNGLEKLFRIHLGSRGLK